MYVIRNKQGYYFHKKGKIILCNSTDEASLLFQGFLNYATARVMADDGGNPMAAIFEVNGVVNDFYITEKDFIEEPRCGTINFRELGI